MMHAPVQADHPATQIRGPELHDPAEITAQLARLDRNVIKAYTQGMIWLVKSWRLLVRAQRLEILRGERQFLLNQLNVLSARDPGAVRAARLRHEAR